MQVAGAHCIAGSSQTEKQQVFTSAGPAVSLQTEPISSIPRSRALLEAIAQCGNSEAPSLDVLYEDAIRDTVARFEATGSPIVQGTALAARIIEGS